jgi:hypothetical protein
VAEFLRGGPACDIEVAAVVLKGLDPKQPIRERY